MSILKKLIIPAAIAFCAVSAPAHAYSDVPAGHWAEDTIARAAEAGIMQGRSEDEFGLGSEIKRSEFAAMLTRLMGWENESAQQHFSDVSPDSWYYSSVNILAAHGAADGDTFRPEDNITRREMAVMLIRSLGYKTLAESETENTFSDVTADSGYIAIARDFGIIIGITDTEFAPESPALREQGAAMMMRLYDKYYSKLDEIHGFYAISSWAQRDIAAQMDSVSFGWGRLEFDNGVKLNTSSDGGNVWCIPDGYTDAVEYMAENGVEANFAVTMTDVEDSKSILLDADARAEAVRQLTAAAEGYAGITIDFEGMKGEELKSGLNEFMKELRQSLGGAKLYIAVHPVLKHGGAYFDAYDYKTLGEYADKVILMAHDYAASTLDPQLLNTDFNATPVTPFDEVYYALKKITDPETGVQDTSKIALALSLSSAAAWKTTDGKISDPAALHPSVETLLKRLAQSDTVISYSQTYRNPYASYRTEDGSEYLIWYEDSRSVTDKIDLAKMFGINDISIWRIGEIADSQPEQYMDIWSAILKEK